MSDELTTVTMHDGPAREEAPGYAVPEPPECEAGEWLTSTVRVCATHEGGEIAALLGDGLCQFGRPRTRRDQ